MKRQQDRRKRPGDLAGVADTVYGLLPDEFTAARNDRAKDATDAGHRRGGDAGGPPR